MTGLTLEEKETIILFNEKDKEAEVYTCNQKLARRLCDLSATCNEIYCTKKDDVSVTYQVPKKLVNIRRPSVLTEEKRAKLVAQITKVNKNRKIGD